ncbi:MAG: aconitate hydratase AcnA [Sneathiella sp.]|uniref:aconitate hydratase AcnA n=1 Tax=Sneathiella sp. TaxID=1964365 RepID=UPI000C5C48B4|nr:aconitate hydratase AcnA [Sneathiella sp.]MAZ03160.1 aconitate hydratase AcnA [Sneathiella sp.]
MTTTGHDSLNIRRSLDIDGEKYDYYSIPEAEKAGLGDVSRLPFSLKVLLENLLRHEDGRTVTSEDVSAIAGWLKNRKADREIAYRPARVLMQDFTGVPAVVDLAAMRDAMVALGGDPEKINPLAQCDLVIDHSVMVDKFGTAASFGQNVELEMERNGERYAFLRWGQKAFNNFRVVPPGTGICHQVNLEYLAQTVWTTKDQNGTEIAYPDTLVGTDSHTTMVNGLAVLGWGVGGIEAEAVMLGQPISMLIPEVVGFKLTGKLKEGTTATDLVLTVTQMLRAQGVVGKFVEFYGPGIAELGLADRATISNMAPEYGATCGFFPIDAETINYLNFTARDPKRVKLVEAYAKAQGMWRDNNTPDPEFTATLELDISTVEPSLAGPKRPQDRVLLSDAANSFKGSLPELAGENANLDVMVDVAGTDYKIGHGNVIIAAITSCTNTSNPSVMLAAGLVARNALKKGLAVKPWVKTSLAPGSKVVTDYLEKAGLQDDLDALGFNLVGYGCTTCIGNSGPVDPHIADAITEGELVACSVLSGNRNFEGRVSPQAKANYLASPPLVVAYAIAGSLNIDITKDSLGTDKDGNPVYLKDIWPSNAEVQKTVKEAVARDMFEHQYADVFSGDSTWQAIKTAEGQTYSWDVTSTYVQHPPYFEGMQKEPGAFEDIRGARILALLGDSVTTDHISPAGAIKADGPAGEYLTSHQVSPKDFNSYGSRRGNDQVMTRGTFANIRLRNEVAPGTEGGVTRHMPDGTQMWIYDASVKYREEDTPLVVFAGKEYGTGSSRDWAAKGTLLLGIKAVVAESFERIHRSNLVGMGILPLQFPEGVTRKTLNLDGSEVIDLTGIEEGVTPGMSVRCNITRADGSSQSIDLLCRIDTLDEVEYYRHDGILQYVLRNLSAS